jgi:hypothetical protein
MSGCKFPSAKEWQAKLDGVVIWRRKTEVGSWKTDFLTAKNTKTYAKDAKKTEARGEFSTLRWEQIPLRDEGVASVSLTG